MTRYRATGKQVLRGDEHVADAADASYAQIIADALNGERVREQRTVELMHTVSRQNDEYACSCGARWDYVDGCAHPI